MRIEPLPPTAGSLAAWAVPAESASLQRKFAPAEAAPAGAAPWTVGALLKGGRNVADREGWSDEELIRSTRQEPGRTQECLDVLFRRYQTRVASWCLRVSGRREEAADLAQEVFLRVYERLDTFRFESAFSTWLYLVTRSVAINRSIANRRRDTDSIDAEGFLEPVDPAPAVDDLAARAELETLLRGAVASELEPLEARILYLHYVDALTLPAIDRLLALTNKSGAKAYLVSAKRKLQRHFAGRDRNLARRSEGMS